ncbi:MAG: TauD/TfdA family dioxygenase [Hydrocarboniphaga sp.]|uniref:TauD/TfdA dioxygenase family protein n=1 Tax=Hydrocarboniphaga sp. TaxID=2033016 RepID=UPI00260F2268|nr:TauD/TfdA family dioxygenase [Hydrocarboniphaga sp.]MDB5968698.1 TauD/TfdA family dioxygenase [Hydrocarboniphaga sp.]
MNIETVDLAPRIGTEILASRGTLLSGSEAQEIRRLLEQRGVVVFRKIDFDDEQQLAFAGTLGEIIAQGNKGIYKVTLDKKENDRADYLLGAFHWHIDGTTDDVPTRASLLSARRLSPSGGQTEFANTYAAYDDLPESEKKSLAKLKVVHHVEVIQRKIHTAPTPEQEASWRLYPPKSHPLVWNHQSGRKSLVLGSTSSHIEGMDIAAGRKLLAELEAWSTQPQFVYQHRWTLGDLLIWDNTGTMHRVVPYALDSGRMMHRTTLVAEEQLV